MEDKDIKDLILNLLKKEGGLSKFKTLKTLRKNHKIGLIQGNQNFTKLEGDRLIRKDGDFYYVCE